VLFLGFASGLPLALTTGTLQVWQTEAGVDLTTIGFFALVGVSYSLKFVWAPLMDRVRLPGVLGAMGRRRGWALLTQFALIAAIVLLGFTDPAAVPVLTALLAVLVAFFSASQDIVIDAYRIELLSERQQGAGAAMIIYGYRIGMLASGAGALHLADSLPWSVVYVVMAVLMLVGVVVVLIAPEPSPRCRLVQSDQTSRSQAIVLLALFALTMGLFVWRSVTPSEEGSGFLSWLPVLLAFVAFLGVGLRMIWGLRRVFPVRGESVAATFAGPRGAADRGSRYGIVALLALAALAIGAFMLLTNLLLPMLDLPGSAVSSIGIVVAAVIPVGAVILLPRPAGEEGPYGQFYAWLSQTVLRPFEDFVSRRGWWLILLFVVLFKLGDAFAGSIANAFYVQIGFEKPEIANVSKLFGLIATLAGVFLGGVLINRLGILKVLLIGGVLQMLSNLMFAVQAQVGHDVAMLAVTIATENVSGGIGTAAFVAYLSSLCNIAFSATQYALLSSLAALGRTVLSAPAGAWAEDMGWINFFLLSTALALPGLIFLLWLMRRLPVPAPAPAGGG
jgi:PAT family beta-lactamase induction signal transducer AmpG